MLGVERYGDYETSAGDSIEVVIWRTVREDGRECDEIAYHYARGGSPDTWFSLRHQRRSFSGIVASFHVSLPDAICLHADVAGALP